MLVLLNNEPQNQQIKFRKKLHLQKRAKFQKLDNFLSHIFFQTQVIAVCAGKICITGFFLWVRILSFDLAE